MATTCFFARDERLPSAEERVARLSMEALPALESILGEETDEIIIMSTIACVLFNAMRQTNWLGFYRHCGEEMLGIGPYQGNLGCLRISFDRGVCGAAARTGKTQLVRDVHEFPGHIACDAASRSELVIPIYNQNSRFIGVLDIDSPFLDGICFEEQRVLEEYLLCAFARVRR